ncbi:cyclic AMP receptor 2 [Fusarium heterosporum]|uniref:Cyclic AMP receptor 2 n=1 Tax=Fusarium heterosporum TaxID=42747 RepID=A0A8H5TEY5_FUSHE|nr:cyclic AMP receptor 2 [Fusarium heterosporum]
MIDKVDRVISSVTLAGSLLSCVATTCVLVSFAIYRRHLRNFRHVLVLNLMVAEFINTLNNSVSGIIFLTTGQLKSGTACVANGFIGQLSVSAADFSVLAISVTTLLTVTRFMYIPNTLATTKALICVAVWIMPLITSLIPTIAGEMKPVGGNWCWISATRPDLRYGMTHGWRLLIIFTTVVIYIYIWIYLRRHLGSKGRARQTLSFSTHNTNTLFSSGSKDVGFRVMKDEEVELDTFNSRYGKIAVPSSPAMFDQGLDWNTRRGDKMDEIEDMGIRQGESEGAISIAGGSMFRRNGGPESIYSAVANSEPQASPRQTQVNVLQTNASEFPQRRDTHNVEIEIKRMMLLNGYPFMYVLLWTPGLVNRLLEALGTPVSETTIAALNTSTQFIGFANAATYGFNHHLRDRLDELLWTPMAMRIKKMFGRR